MSVKKVDINSLNTKNKIDNLINTLNYECNYELNFYHIKFLPKTLINKMYSIKHNLTISVDNMKLSYYLINLGFELISFTNKSYYSFLHKIKYVAIGGSAGSLTKIIDIIKFLPKSDLSLFIIMHHKSNQKSDLCKILKNYTVYYNIVEVTNTIKIEPSTIYIAPPSQHLLVKDNYLILDDSAPKYFSKPSISVSFNSFANEFKDKLLAIILCGYGEDGSHSLKNIKQNGGSVIIEQPFECQATAMIEAAINTNNFDKILSINDISKLFFDKYYKLYSIEQNLESFLLDLKNKYHYDYSNYNKKHIIRRIEHFYNILNVSNFSIFKQKIINDKELFEELFLDISVNVTTFFRNPEVYTQIKDLFKDKFNNNSSFKIWCAGCSTGEEPYSIAILLKELGYLDRSIIYATDINKVVIEFAKNGLYPKHKYTEFRNNYQKSLNNDNFDSYFNINDDFISIKDEITEKILFFTHNLVENEKIDDFQVIICRNLLIYFNKNLTIQVYDLFDKSLDKNGLLILGKSETFYNSKSYKEINKLNKIFSKQE